MDPATHAKKVQIYLKHRAELHDTVTETTKRQKEDEVMRYNKGIKGKTV